MENFIIVKTILRKDKQRKDDTYPLYLSFSIKGKPYRLSTGRSIRKEHWNEETCRANKKFYKWKNLNAFLKDLESAIDSYVANLKVSGEKLSFEKIKRFYYEYIGKECKEYTRDFYFHFDEFTKLKFTRISKGTQNHYLLLRKQLKEYKTFLTLEDLDNRFFKDFFYYLENVKKIGNSGLAMRRKNFITILEEFIKDDLIIKNYCKNIQPFEENKRTEFLTPEELFRLKKIDLNFGIKTKGLNLTRDMFLFATYTGLRFSDVCKITKENIIGGKIDLVMEKTKKPIKVPLKKEALKILIKYNTKDARKPIFPKRTNVSVNRDLKLIAKMARIKKRVTFHVSRHSFGSILAMNDVNPFSIKELMGHGDIRMTDRYVNTNYEILKGVMEKVNFSVNV